MKRSAATAAISQEFPTTRSRAVLQIWDLSPWPAPSSWLVPCCWAAVHSWPPSCLPLAAPMCLLLQQALEPQQLWPRPPWWHHRQHLLMRAPCGSLLCPPLALASPLAWLQLVRVLARALLPADALMASPVSLRWQMTCEVCCCCPWHSWSPWRFMAWWLPWCSSSPTHSSSELLIKWVADHFEDIGCRRKLFPETYDQWSTVDIHTCAVWALKLLERGLEKDDSSSAEHLPGSCFPFFPYFSQSAASDSLWPSTARWTYWTDQAILVAMQYDAEELSRSAPTSQVGTPWRWERGLFYIQW